MKNNIRQIREAQGLTIATLAGRVGLSTAHLSELETGKKRVNEDHLTDIAQGLGVRIVDLIAEEPVNFGLPQEIRAHAERLMAVPARDRLAILEHAELLARMSPLDRAAVLQHARGLVALAGVTDQAGSPPA